MTTGDDSPAGPRVDIRKERPDETPQARPGPAWIVIPVRVIALIVVVPLRLVHDLALLVARGVRTAWNALMRAPARLARIIGRMLHAIWLKLYQWLFAPIARLAGAIARGIGALFDLLIARPLRWLAVVVILGFLRWFGRGTGRLAQWLYRMLIVPVGRFLALVGRGLRWLIEQAVLRPLRALGRGLAWLLNVTAHALALLLKGIITGISLLAIVLLVIPVTFLWRYILRPPLLGLLLLARAIRDGLAWLGRGALSVLGALGRVLAAGWRAFAGAVAWAWDFIGRFLAWLARILIVLPARTVWRYVLAPIVAGIVATWRLAGRILRRLWRTLVVLPVRVLIAAPARWAMRSVLRPIGHRTREAWQVSVRDPLRAARQTIRETTRDVRLQLRRAFRRP